ncbi:thiol:disulfide interchange protein TlpA [Methylosinus sporium]|uniref:Thiol:disulfide interchange protein n=1 Tax=Methylosinus sporium TaxID=428 RepID=A0A2U1SV14_METSR|nr:TlpA disulfide reductase family protein [Methylosinus sporium]PWB95464.1 thiol:disulfide interchange protein [Methylosinus sporium]
MTDQMESSSRGNLPKIAGATLAVAAVAGVLYVNGGGSGKTSVVSEACAASRETSQRVSALAKGEVAAMSIANAPEPMPEVTFTGPDGKPRKLEDFKGKTVLLNLWATWCVPCRGEMAALDRLQAAAGSDKFEVVTINVDTSRLERPKAFLGEIGAKNLAYYADPKAEIFFQLRQSGQALGLPTTFLIDGSGCQIGLMQGPANWDSEEGRSLVTRTAEISSRPTPTTP